MRTCKGTTCFKEGACSERGAQNAGSWRKAGKAASAYPVNSGETALALLLQTAVQHGPQAGAQCPEIYPPH